MAGIRVATVEKEDLTVSTVSHKVYLVMVGINVTKDKE